MEPTTENTPTHKVHWEKWTAIGTVMMALCALATSLWQGAVLQQHNRLSVRPVLEFVSNYDVLPDGRLVYEILIENNGLGPAQVTKFTASIAGKNLDSAHEIWQAAGIELPAQCRGAGNALHFYKTDAQQMVIRVPADAGCGLQPAEFDKLKGLKLDIEYQSLYGETFTTGFSF